MRGVFRLVDTLTAVTTAKQLLYLAAPSGAVVEILSARVTAQDDDTSEQIMVELNRATGTVGGGDALTSKPTEEGSAAYGGSAKGGNTAITGMTPDGESDAIASGGANKLAGWEYVPLPEERATLAPDDQLVLRTVDDISAATDLTCEITFREIG